MAIKSKPPVLFLPYRPPGGRCLRFRWRRRGGGLVVEGEYQTVTIYPRCRTSPPTPSTRRMSLVSGDSRLSPLNLISLVQRYTQRPGRIAAKKT